MTDNPAARKEALAWAVRYLKTVDIARVDLSELVKPVISCLEDKSGEIRTQATQVLEPVVRNLGIGAVRKGCKDLKPASMCALSFLFVCYELCLMMAM